MTRPVPQAAIDFMKSWENLRLVPYRDQGGKWTCGYGSTGLRVVPGVMWSKSDAEAHFAEDVRVAATRLKRALGPAVASLTDNQYAAMIAFTDNAGADPTWQVFRDIQLGNLADVPRQLRRFDHVRIKGVLTTSLGLDHRRAAEIELWLKA